MMCLLPRCRGFLLAGGVALGVLALAGTMTSESFQPMKVSPEKPAKIQQPGTLTEAEWRARLTPEQYRILRQAGTERSFGEIYQQFKEQGAGDYYCAGCGAHLFTSLHKFDSHCGWPSFYDPASIESVKLHEDRSLGMVRTEVVCANCNGHLGHLFKGEGFDTPVDQRFCINGAVLTFVPAGGTPPKPSSSGAGE